MMRFLMRCILWSECSTCRGVIAQKSMVSSSLSRGFVEGSVAISFISFIRARTNIIFPEIYSIGRQRSAVSFFFNRKKSVVITAELIIFCFSTSNILGAPVDPEVCTFTVSCKENHSSIKEKSFFSNSLLTPKKLIFRLLTLFISITPDLFCVKI